MNGKRTEWMVAVKNGDQIQNVESWQGLYHLEIIFIRLYVNEDLEQENYKMRVKIKKKLINLFKLLDNR